MRPHGTARAPSQPILLMLNEERFCLLLGPAVRQRLVVDPKEAEVVRSIFTGFVEQDAVTALIKDLADRGIMSGMHQTCRFKRSTSATKAGVNSAISVSMSRTWC